MPDPDSGPEPTPQGDIRDQVVISFNMDLARSGMPGALAAVDNAVKRLEHHQVTVLEQYVAPTSDEEAFFAVILGRLDSPAATLEELRNDSVFLNISLIERNQPIALARYDDPLLTQQWALDKLGATDPWTVAPPGAGKTIVGIIDTGLFGVGPAGRYHSDLGSVENVVDCQPQPIVIGYTTWFPGLHVDGVDQDGHGTLLAGTIAAVPGNGAGVSSAVQPSWNISLLPVKFFSPAASPDALHAAIAIAHAVGKRAKVINASWHVARGDTFMWVLDLALDFAARRGSLVVISAGNDGTDNEIYPTYPANLGTKYQDNTLTVAASGRDDFKASYSNYGRNIVDIAAPGTAIVSTARYLLDPPRYADYSGTSAAAAFVSSAAALVFALNPPNWDGAAAAGWTPRDVKQHLRASAETIEGLKLACVGGKRLNIARAVYGPLTLTAPAAGATLAVGVAAAISWTVAYDNPKLTHVKVDFITGANTHHLGTIPIGNGVLSWTPTTAHVGVGWIRIRPTDGNFPVRSGLVAVVS